MPDGTSCQAIRRLPGPMDPEHVAYEGREHYNAPAACALRFNELRLSIDSLQCPGNSDHPRLQVQIAPPKPQQLPAAQAGRQRKNVEGLQPVATPADPRSTQ